MPVFLCRRPPENASFMTLIPVERRFFSLAPVPLDLVKVVSHHRRLPPLREEETCYDNVENTLFLRLPKKLSSEELEAVYACALRVAADRNEKGVLLPMIPLAGDFHPALIAAHRAALRGGEDRNVYLLWFGASPAVLFSVSSANMSLIA